MAPSFDLRSFINFCVLWSQRLWCSGEGGGYISPSQGVLRQIFLTRGGGVEPSAQMRKLPVSTYRPKSKQANAGFGDSRSKALLPPTLFLTLGGTAAAGLAQRKSELPPSNTLEMRGRNRKPDRQRRTADQHFRTRNPSHMTQLSLCQTRSTPFNRWKWMSDLDVYKQNQ